MLCIPFVAVAQSGSIRGTILDPDGLPVIGGKALQQVVMVADNKGPGGVCKRGQFQDAPDVLGLHARLRPVRKAGGKGAAGDEYDGDDQTDGFFADHREEDLRLGLSPLPPRFAPPWAELPEAEEALRLPGWV